MAFAYMSLVPQDTIGAGEAAAAALRINPNDNQANLALARINLIMDRPGPAIGHYIEAAGFMIPARDASFAGKILTRENKLAEAEIALRTAAAIDSLNKDYLSELGNNLISQQKYTDAAEIFKRVLDVDPKSTKALVNLGNVEMAAGDPDKAEASYLKALTIDDCYAPAHKALGDVFVARGANGQAMTSYRRAMECSPDDRTGSDAASALGYVLWQQNDFVGAIPVLKQALEFDRCNLHAILTIANCYQKLGQDAEAIAALRRGQGCDAGNAAIREALRSLGQ
jgi:tetratricopeptide (TPR) repeat protein